MGLLTHLAAYQIGKNSGRSEIPRCETITQKVIEKVVEIPKDVCKQNVYTPVHWPYSIGIFVTGFIIGIIFKKILSH